MKQHIVKHRSSSLRRLLLGLGALTLGLPGAEAQTVRTGEMALELGTGGQLSYIGVDVVELEASLCNALPSPWIRDPKLVVANDGGHTGRAFGLDVTLATESGGGTQIAVEVLPGALRLAGPGSLPTACGSWSYRLSLDPGAPPPVSTLTLLRTRPADLGGAFVGSVSFAAQLELTPLAGGVTQWRTYSLELDLAGTWGLAEGSGGRGSGVGAAPANASNLILFAQKSGTSWVKNAQAAATESQEDPNPGQLVLQPTDDALAWLNPPRLR